MGEQIPNKVEKEERKEKGNKDESVLFKYSLNEKEQPDEDFFNTIQKAVNSLYSKHERHKDLIVAIESSQLSSSENNDWRLDLTQNQEGIINLVDISDAGYKIEIPIRTLRSIVIRKATDEQTS